MAIVMMTVMVMAVVVRMVVLVMVMSMADTVVIVMAIAMVRVMVIARASDRLGWLVFSVAVTCRNDRYAVLCRCLARLLLHTAFAIS